MPNQFLDSNGKRVVLGRRLGVGGEGAVYEIAGTSDWVAKVYSQGVPSDKASKLSSMVQHASEDLRKVAAWPRSTLHDSDNMATVGIIMPRVQGAREIHELYSPAQRKIHFPDIDWRFLIRTARNCAAAFASLHKSNIIIGDVNQGNIFVSQRAVVSLIDCDSFQIAANGSTHLCQVGVPHFTPPELQSANFRQVVRTANHDCFGLAVLIFHLLFMGRHPFVGRFRGPGDMPIEKAICEQRFAYGPSAKSREMQPPPNTLTFSEIPGDVAKLFERAFCTIQRGSAEEWVDALTGMESQVSKCKVDPGHFYLTRLPLCPWCRVVNEGGPNFFVSVTLRLLVGHQGDFDVEAVWVEIQDVKAPSQIVRQQARKAIGRLQPVPLPEGVNDQFVLRRLIGQVAVAAGWFNVLAIFNHSLALFTVPILVVFAAWWMGLYFISPLRRIYSERQSRLRHAESELHQARQSYESIIRRHESRFHEKLGSLGQIKATLDSMGDAREAGLRSLHRDLRKKQLDNFLRNAFICRASIPGIGPVRVSALESYGIETAYDISTSSVNRVPGFGRIYTRNLVAWRGEVERSFRFDPSKGVARLDTQEMELKYRQQRVQMEQAFALGPAELRQISAAAQLEAARVDRLVANLEMVVAQAKADVAGVK